MLQNSETCPHLSPHSPLMIWTASTVNSQGPIWGRWSECKLVCRKQKTCGDTGMIQGLLGFVSRSCWWSSSVPACPFQEVVPNFFTTWEQIFTRISSCSRGITKTHRRGARKFSEVRSLEWDLCVDSCLLLALSHLFPLASPLLPVWEIFVGI